VLEPPRFLAFRPFAAASPFETWIVPRSHQPSFGKANDGTLDDRAPVLRAVLGGLRRALNESGPQHHPAERACGDEHLECFIWHLRIVPRRSTPAGVELGSG
jgi:UDPglucose--hexose-1-phosphate uridylyltransferase